MTFDVTGIGIERKYLRYSEVWPVDCPGACEGALVAGPEKHAELFDSVSEKK